MSTCKCSIWQAYPRKTWVCSTVAQLLLNCCSTVAQLLLNCCSTVAQLLLNCCSTAPMCGCATSNSFLHLRCLPCCSAVCTAGYGGASAAACASCGGVDTSATYGPSTRTNDETACIDCPVSAAGCNFIWGGINVPYMSVAISKSNADSPADCFALYTQVEDQAWELEGASTSDVAATLADCVAACSGATDCMFMTFSYSDNQCNLRVATGTG